MASRVPPIPPGYHTITPYLVVQDAGKAIEFYKKAFGAVERARMPGPGGKIMHAEVKIGDSIVMLCDEMPDMLVFSPQTFKGTPVRMMVYTEDVDALFRRAVQAGATAQMPPQDMFWGDRFGKLKDPFGHEWNLATHKEDLAPDEIARRQEAFFASVAKKG
jgi:PhnB protein